MILPNDVAILESVVDWWDQLEYHDIYGIRDQSIAELLYVSESQRRLEIEEALRKNLGENVTLIERRT